MEAEADAIIGGQLSGSKRRFEVWRIMRGKREFYYITDRDDIEWNVEVGSHPDARMDAVGLAARLNDNWVQRLQAWLDAMAKANPRQMALLPPHDPAVADQPLD